MATETGAIVSGAGLGFQYVLLRCVPRADREEFINVGVILYCQNAGYLASASRLDAGRLWALSPGLNVAAVTSALAAIDAVCRGESPAGAASQLPLGPRFGWLTAPRSTVVRPGPIHGGLTADPAAELARVLHRDVG